MQQEKQQQFHCDAAKAEGSDGIDGEKAEENNGDEDLATLAIEGEKVDADEGDEELASQSSSGSSWLGTTNMEETQADRLGNLCWRRDLSYQFRALFAWKDLVWRGRATVVGRDKAKDKGKGKGGGRA